MLGRKKLSPIREIQQAQIKVMHACIEAISTQLTTTDLSRVRDILNQTINDWDSLEPIIWEPITSDWTIPEPIITEWKVQ